MKNEEFFFVFLLLTVGLVMLIFFMMDDSFAESFKSSKECDISYDVIENEGFWSRKVKDDVSVKAILPDDPCEFRRFNNWMENNSENYNDSINHWHTGIVLHRIGNINTVAGTYDMKFQYYVEVFNNDTFTDFKEKPPKIDFINMVGNPKMLEKTKGFNQTKNYYDATISGTFYTDINFKQFPFEKLKLNIIAEPSYEYDDTLNVGYESGSQSDSIQFHIWPYYGLLKPDIPSPGYEIVEYEFSAYNYRRDLGSDYSRFEANYIVQRQFLDSFLKFIFPLLILSSLAIATVCFPSESYMTKISLNAAFFLGMLFFVQIVQGKLPNIEDMTIFDFIVITNYSIIVVAIIIPAAKWKKFRRYEKEKIERDDWKEIDKMNHALNLENLNRTEADMLFFKDKLNSAKGSERTKFKRVVTQLKDRRKNLDTLKNVDATISVLAQKRTDYERIDFNDKEFQKLNPEQISMKVAHYKKETKNIRTAKQEEYLERLENVVSRYETLQPETIVRMKLALQDEIDRKREKLDEIVKQKRQKLDDEFDLEYQKLEEEFQKRKLSINNDQTDFTQKSDLTPELVTEESQSVSKTQQTSTNYNVQKSRAELFEEYEKDYLIRLDKDDTKMDAAKDDFTSLREPPVWNLNILYETQKENENNFKSQIEGLNKKSKDKHSEIDEKFNNTLRALNQELVVRRSEIDAKFNKITIIKDVLQKGNLHKKKRDVYQTWKKYGKMIIIEEQFEKAKAKISMIDELQKERSEITKQLRKLEVEIEDENREMVISDKIILDNKKVDIISKNDVTELKELDKFNHTCNIYAFSAFGIIYAVGLIVIFSIQT